MKTIKWGFYISSLFLLSCTHKDQEIKITSPDSKISATVLLQEGKLAYEVSKNNADIIEKSFMGFDIKDMPDLGGNLKLVSFENTTYDDTWEQVWGEQQFVRNNYNEVLLKLQETKSPKRLLNIRFRVFNDGVGFRYEFPEQKMKDFVIMQEKTEFNIPADEQAWSIPSPAYYTRYYESLYTKRNISAVNDTVTTPVTIEFSNGKHIAIHEAALTDYAKMNLFLKEGTTLQSDLSPWSTGEKVFASTPFETPWRTVVVAENAGDLLSSTMMLNLNEPNKLNDTEWIQPQKYVGVWWGMHMRKYTWKEGPKHGAATPIVKEYIDFAAENNCKGVLVEGWNIGWNGNWAKNGDKFRFAEPYPDFDIEYLSKYAKEKGVQIIGHHETAGSMKNYETQFDEAFSFCNKYNISSVKTGYVSKFVDGKEVHDGQYGVRHQLKNIQTAAKYNVSIVNHEPVMPTGLSRTYPNLLALEGMRGQEYDAWSKDGGNPPSHTVILPFTRGLAGPMDFTPGTFQFKNSAHPETRVQTTIAKQLALYVTIYSPVQMASDLIENYKGNKAFTFIKNVATDWEESRVLSAKIGEYLTVARKAKDSEDWFLGAITNENKREQVLSLEFLTDGIQYNASIYEDGADADWKENPTSINIKNVVVDNKTDLTLNLANGGGTAIHFTPIAD
ncbi:MAG: glycoside hydrolase family 97 protein [Bacteroidales bacterium]